MADKHNAGPWNVEPLQSTHGADMAICAPGVGVVAVIQHDPDIQDCEEPDGETVKWHPADLANAALIAEAPAMLAIVRQLHQGDTTAPAIDRLLAECRAIVARIDGAGGEVLGHPGNCQHCGEVLPLGAGSASPCGACGGLNFTREG